MNTTLEIPQPKAAATTTQLDQLKQFTVVVADTGDFATLIDELLLTHYDPTYGRSIMRNFPRYAEAISVTPHAIDPAAFRALARDVEAQLNALPALMACAS